MVNTRLQFSGHFVGLGTSQELVHQVLLLDAICDVLSLFVKHL